MKTNYKGNVKLTWKLRNEIINKKKIRQDIPDSFNRNRTIVSNQKEIANNLNEYFVNVGPRLAKKISEQSTNYKAYLTNTDNNSTFLDLITEKEVEVEISLLKENNATRYGDLAPKVVKKISKYIV